jgi:hypothetical protein
MHAFVDGLGLSYLTGKAAAASLTFGANFILRRWLLFTRWSPTRMADPRS